VFQGTINFGTRGPRTFVREHFVSGRPVIPPDRRRGDVTSLNEPFPYDVSMVKDSGQNTVKYLDSVFDHEFYTW